MINSTIGLDKWLATAAAACHWATSVIAWQLGKNDKDGDFEHEADGEDYRGGGGELKCEVIFIVTIVILHSFPYVIVFVAIITVVVSPAIIFHQVGTGIGINDGKSNIHKCPENVNSNGETKGKGITSKVKGHFYQCVNWDNHNKTQGSKVKVR